MTRDRRVALGLAMALVMLALGASVIAPSLEFIFATRLGG